MQSETCTFSQMFCKMYVSAQINCLTLTVSLQKGYTIVLLTLTIANSHHHYPGLRTKCGMNPSLTPLNSFALKTIHPVNSILDHELMLKTNHTKYYKTLCLK